MKITVKQLKQLIKEQIEEADVSDTNDLFAAYPSEMRILLAQLYNKDLLRWSSDAAGDGRGLGLWVSNDSLVKLIKYLRT